MSKLKIIYLKSAKNLQELKKLYFTLAKRWHPDLEHGNTIVMQQVNNEYDYLKTILKNSVNEETKKDYKDNAQSMDNFKIIIDDLLKYNKIVIEVIGSWLWISGNGTFSIKEEILYNKYHFEYSKHNKKFYWYDGIENAANYKYKGGFLNKAIEKYGITRIESESSYQLA